MALNYRSELPQVALLKAVAKGRYRAAEKAMLRGASFVDLTDDLLWDFWEQGLTHGPICLDWLLNHAGAPTSSLVWSTLLGQSWVRGRAEVAQWLLEHGADVNGRTFGAGTPFAFALKAPHEATFEWAWDQTNRTMGSHNPFAVIWSLKYPLMPWLAISGPVMAQPARWARLMDEFLPRYKACEALLKGPLSPDDFLLAWRMLAQHQEGWFQTKSHASTAREHPRLGATFQAWEKSCQRHDHLQKSDSQVAAPRYRIRG